jgi:hypothetical protein
MSLHHRKVGQALSVRACVPTPRAREPTLVMDWLVFFKSSRAFVHRSSSRSRSTAAPTAAPVAGGSMPEHALPMLDGSSTPTVLVSTAAPAVPAAPVAPSIPSVPVDAPTRGNSHADEAIGVVTPEGRAPKRRVSFGRAVVRVVEPDGVAPLHETEAEVRSSDEGKYYPVSAARKQSGDEYQKKWPKAAEAEPDVFCRCTDGCRSGECPCARDGVGCWWEGWGCGCSGVCRAEAIPCHVYDELAVRKERRRVLVQTKRESIGGKRRRVSSSPRS